MPNLGATMSDNPIFNSEWIKNVPSTYVAWVDVMGIQNAMKRSLPTVSNFIFKFQMLVSRAEKGMMPLKTLRLMDGCYVFAEKAADMKRFLQKLFHGVSDDFISAKKDEHRYLIRGALAYGPLVRGEQIFGEINVTESRELLSNCRDSMFVGIPVSQAYIGEKEAPPFGLFVHESVRSVNHRDAFFSQKWLKIYEAYENMDIFPQKVAEYFKFCEDRSCFLDYPKEKISEHQKKFEQYMTLHGSSIGTL